MFQRIEGTSVLTLPRSDWNTFVGTLGTPVLLDVRSTPMAGITAVSSVVATVAHQFGSASACVSIFRHDPKDEPTPVNQDVYDVWTDLSQHPKFPDMVSAESSASGVAEVKHYCGDYVFFVKRPPPGADHWLPTVPGSVTVLVKRFDERPRTVSGRGHG